MDAGDITLAKKRKKKRKVKKIDAVTGKTTEVEEEVEVDEGEPVVATANHESPPATPACGSTT
jgi:hypothetical protein